MKYCISCGKELADNAKFCYACGAQCAQVYSDAQREHDYEQYCLGRMDASLKHQALARKIYGIVMTVLAGIFVIYALLMFFAGGMITSNSYRGSEDYAAGLLFVLLGIYMLFFAVIFAPLAIVNLVMSGKVRGYREKLYTDCTDAVKHSASIGNIVFTAIFNEIALIFVIINFVFVKKNRTAFEKIKQNQNEYNSRIV